MRSGYLLATVITRSALRREAFGASYTRGRAYFDSGAVASLAERDGAVDAQVRGTRVYNVRLWAEDGLAYSCSCPVGADGLFCKHCVAVGLAWLARGRQAGPDHSAMVSSDDIRAHLLQQDTATLTEIVMQRAAQDPDFRRVLALRVVAGRGDGADVKHVRQAILDATRASAAYYPNELARVRESFEVVRMMSDAGQAAGALELAGFAVARLAVLANGYYYHNPMPGVLLREAIELHRALCRKHKPDRVRLAQWLFECMTAPDGALSSTVLSDYVPLLGVEGMVEFRRLAFEAWDRVPAIGPQDSPKVAVGREHARYAPPVKAIADFTNNHEDHVRFWERDLSTSEQFLRIAGAFAAARRHDRAIEWAERGVRELPEILTERLRDLLLEQYLAVGRVNDALNIVWGEFARCASVQQYVKLRGVAEKAGQWPTWREEALELLRGRAAEERKRRSSPGRGKYSREVGDTLVVLQLSEGDVEGAWRSSRNASLSEAVFIALARARAKTHPLDAAIVYRELAEWLVSDKGGKRYKPAVELLLKSARLFKRAKVREEFQEYLAAFRETHKRRWGLARLLDSARWP